MKSYTITVNGNVYDVTVEENGAVSAPAATPGRALHRSSTCSIKPAAAAGAGSVKIERAQRKVFKLEKSVGDAVKKGDSIMVLEIMKMELRSLQRRTVRYASINVKCWRYGRSGRITCNIKLI